MSELLIRLGRSILLFMTTPTFWILLLIAILLAVAVSWYRRRKLRALSRMEYTRSVSRDGAFVGEELEMTETLRNTCFFPLLFVRMEFFMPAGLNVDGIACAEYTKTSSVFHIPPYATVRKVHRIRADLRGHYLLETATVRYRKEELLFSAPIDFYAYPAYRRPNLPLSIELRHAGDRISDQKYVEDPFFLSSIRPYRVGDPFRSVNFKASVRSFSGGVRQLMSNSFDSSRCYDAMIVLDLSESDEEGRAIDDKAILELGLSYACFLLCETLRMGGRIGFVSNCATARQPFVRYPCGSGSGYAETLLECFAELNGYIRRSYSIHSLLQQAFDGLDRSTEVYLLTPCVDDRCAEILHRMRRSGRCVSVIPLRDRGRSV